MEKAELLTELKWIDKYYDYGTAPPLRYWGQDRLRNLIRKLEEE